MTRKVIKRQRLAILNEIDRLNELRCEKCQHGAEKAGVHQCDCDAAVQIRKLGVQLNKLAKKPEKKPIEPRKSLTVDEYQNMKADDMRDKEIYEKIGWGRNKFYNWKVKNGLVGKTPYPKRSPTIPDVLKGLSVEEYKNRKNNGVTDAHIMETYDISSTTLWRWKEFHKLIDKPGRNTPKKAQNPPNQPKEGEPMIHTTEKQNASKNMQMVSNDVEEKVVEFTQAETVEKSVYDKLLSDYNDLMDSSSSQIATLQQENWKLKGEYEELTEAKRSLGREYLKACADFRDERRENERLKAELDKLGHVRLLNHLLMKDSVIVNHDKFGVTG